MKHAILRLHVNILLEICKRGVEHINVVKNALPEDAKFIRAGHDQYGSLFLVLESNSFEDLKEGDLLPELPYPMFEKK